MVAPEPARVRRSVSQFTTYAQCGEQFRLQKIARAPSRPACWFHQGTASHHVIEAYETGGRELAIDDAVTMFNAEYDRLVEADLIKWPEWDAWMTGGAKKGEKDMEDRKALGAWQVREYFKYAEENAANWRVIASEVEFVIELGGVEVLGYIDQIRQHIDGQIEVADLKGGSTIPGSAFQLGVYALAAEEYMGERPTKASFIKLARMKQGNAKERPTTELTHDLAPWTREMIGRMFSEFDKAERLGIYLPNPTEDCHRTCGAAQFCSVPGKGHAESAAPFATIRTREQYLAQQKEVA